jgi:uncharacterized membrane protein (UPF0127 family)
VKNVSGMKACNQRNRAYLATNVSIADTVTKRMKGLLGRDIFLPGDGMWLKPCNWIHTFGMRFPVDVIYLDRESVVVAVQENIPPNRFALPVFKAKSTIELPIGTVSSSKTRVGDIIVFSV